MVIKHVAFIKQKVSEMKEVSRFPTINAVAQSSVRKGQLLLITEFWRTLCLAQCLPTLMQSMNHFFLFFIVSALSFVFCVL